jgi:hypothetical protein
MPKKMFAVAPLQREILYYSFQSMGYLMRKLGLFRLAVDFPCSYTPPAFWHVMVPKIRESGQ